MNYLGERNLLSSQFTIGCRECDKINTKTETKEIEAFHRWISFKDSDPMMKRYRSERTQYVAFLEIIDLEVLKGIAYSLYLIYSKEYPYSEKEDFINDVFGRTIYELKTFLEIDLTFIGVAPDEKEFVFYYSYSQRDLEFIDFAIGSNYDLKYVQQYYKAVLSFFNDFKKPQEQKSLLREDAVKESVGESLKFTINNEGLANVENPDFVNGLKNLIQKSTSLKTVNVIQELPGRFYEWRKEINGYEKTHRINKIKQQVELLSGVLTEWSFEDRVIAQGIESVRTELSEQLNYWKDQLESNSEVSQDQPNELDTKIKFHLDFLQNQCPRRHTIILKQDDFNRFIEWNNKYYSNNFQVPEITEPIKTINTNKTFVQLAFKYLFKELNPGSPYPDSLFEFYRSSFLPYREDMKKNFSSVANKPEVKKLMRIG